MGGRQGEPLPLPWVCSSSSAAAHLHRSTACGGPPRCSLGAGTAALVSLKLRERFPGLKCIAYSCPGERHRQAGAWGSGVGRQHACAVPALQRGSLLQPATNRPCQATNVPHPPLAFPCRWPGQQEPGACNGALHHHGWVRPGERGVPADGLASCRVDRPLFPCRLSGRIPALATLVPACLPASLRNS